MTAFLITACGSSSSSSSENGNNGNTGKKTDINTFALSYKGGGTYIRNTEHTLKPEKNDIPAEAEAVYSITAVPASAKISVNQTDGTVTIEKDIAAGSYTLTVTAAADNAKYTGKKTGTEFTVTVVPRKDLNTYRLVYKGGSYTNKIEHMLSLLPSQNSIPPEVKAVYTLTSDPSNDKITVNPADGKITAAIAKGDPTGDYKLTVTASASADNANYTGSKTSPVFTVTVDNASKQNISAYSLGYGTGTPQIKTGGEILATAGTIPKEASADFSADNLGTGITIDRATGKITVGGTALDGTHDITVTASVPAGNTVYTGTKSETVSFYVISAAGYKPDTEQAASKGFFTAGDIDNPALVSLTGVTDDKTVSDYKIEIKGQGSNTSFYNGTATTPKKQDGKVTLGIPAPGIAYSDFNNITADATIDITVSAKVNGKNIAKTFVKTKASATNIYSWRDLDKVRNDFNASYTLKNDIAFPAENTYGYTDTFNPIGDLSNAFTGKFDGNGKTISGLKITGTAMDYRGLFGRVSGAGAEIKNLVIDHRGISGKEYVGAVAGRVTSGAVITNVGMISTTGDVVTGSYYVGGLTGEVTSNSKLTGYATGDVSGNDAGGLTGWVTRSTVTGYSTGKVSSTGAAGGLACIIEKSTVTGYATGAVSGSNGVGGLAGWVTSSTITGYATGAVSDNLRVGGMVGYLKDNSTAIGYARNSVTRKSGTENGFGLLTGLVTNSTSNGYHSATESKLLKGDETALTGTTGINGDAVTMAPGITQTIFDKANTANPGHFTFGTATGEWIWVKDGNWPAINLPPEVGGNYKAADQPTAP